MTCNSLLRWLSALGVLFVGCADPNKPPEHPDNPIPREQDPVGDLDDEDEDDVEDLDLDDDDPGTVPGPDDQTD